MLFTSKKYKISVFECLEKDGIISWIFMFIYYNNIDIMCISSNMIVAILVFLRCKIVLIAYTKHANIRLLIALCSSTYMSKLFNHHLTQILCYSPTWTSNIKWYYLLLSAYINILDLLMRYSRKRKILNNKQKKDTQWNFAKKHLNKFSSFEIQLCPPMKIVMFNMCSHEIHYKTRD